MRRRYEKVYTLPLLTISMTKGTGIVTCVPSDAPTDFAAMRDLKEKPKLREKYHLTDEMVLPSDVVEIIEVPGMAAEPAQHDGKIQMKIFDYLFFLGAENIVIDNG